MCSSTEKANKLQWMNSMIWLKFVQKKGQFNGLMILAQDLIKNLKNTMIERQMKKQVSRRPQHAQSTAPSVVNSIAYGSRVLFLFQCIFNFRCIRNIPTFLNGVSMESHFFLHELVCVLWTVFFIHPRFKISSECSFFVAEEFLQLVFGAEYYDVVNECREVENMALK